MRKNRTDAPQYYVADNHPAIISNETFAAVQQEMARRANLLGDKSRRRVYSEKYAFSGLIFCGDCGDINQARSHRAVNLDFAEECIADGVNAERDEKALEAQRTKDMRECGEFFNGMKSALEIFEGQYIRRFIEKITVYDDRFEFRFRDGQEITVNE